jgi:hypothetical protein
VNTISGAKPQEIEQLLIQYSASAGTSDESFPAGQMSLVSFIDTKNSTALNRNEDQGNLVEVIQGKSKKPLESDCDEQLLLIVPFNQQVRLHSLKIQAPDDGRAPATVKVKNKFLLFWEYPDYWSSFNELELLQVFINQPNMDFSSVEDTDPDQEIVFSKPTETLELDYVKWVPKRLSVGSNKYFNMTNEWRNVVFKV